MGQRRVISAVAVVLAMLLYNIVISVSEYQLQL